MKPRAKYAGPRTKGAGRAVALVLGPLCFVLGAAGCRGSCDLVEAELRSRDRELREVREELHRMQLYNDGLQRELRALKRNCSSKLPPEEATLIFSLKSISLGRQTGGYDADDCPGDEALQVVLEPRDLDNHPIKVPGTLEVQALEISAEGLKRPLSSWQLTPDQLRRTWRSGLLSSGYFVVLPWKAWPATEKLRVVARFTLADGRAFEADRDVTVRLPPASRRPPLPAIPEPLPEPPPIEQAPPPRQIDPPKAPAEKTADAQPAGLLRNAVQVLPPRPR
ncbi:MAG TPA: hypothetical protein VNK04_20620 [Gemmataceae bacterium]|nr:hypothetical protein [Gemmataceae bacterium]